MKHDQAKMLEAVKRVIKGERQIDVAKDVGVRPNVLSYYFRRMTGRRKTTRRSTRSRRTMIVREQKTTKDTLIDVMVGLLRGGNIDAATALIPIIKKVKKQ